jgi:hypothetical protein
VSTIILWKSQNHDDKFGPKSEYGRSRSVEGGDRIVPPYKEERAGSPSVTE